MMNEFDFVTEKNLRSKAVENELSIAKMQMVKELLLLDGTELATTEMVATYYNVEIDTIKKVVERNYIELTSNGYRVLEGEELRDIKSLCQLKSRARSLALFSKRAILNVGMLLRDSEVAKELRSRLLDIIYDADKGIGNTQTIVEEIDETTKLSMELGVAMINGDFIKCMEINAKINELKNKRINELESTIDTIKTKATNIEDFRRQANVLIRAIANSKGVKQNEMWSDFYNYLEDKTGYKLYTRQENKIKKVNEERIAESKKPYKSSTAKSKFSIISMIKENEYDEVLEILKGIALKYDININEKLSI